MPREDHIFDIILSEEDSESEEFILRGIAFLARNLGLPGLDARAKTT